jgi:hypothetical protein
VASGVKRAPILTLSTIGAALGAGALVLSCSHLAWAQDKDEEDAPSLPSLQEEPPATAEDLLQQQIQEMRDRLKASEEAARNAKSPLTIQGYADLGFFVPAGNGGAGWVRDAGNQQFPEYNRYAWTFLGDILSTTINTRGEVADMGEVPGMDRFDSVNSNGAASFLVNELNLRLGYSLSDAALLRTSVNFMPRSGDNFALGDFLEIDLAELEYVLTDDGNTSLFVGKSLPSFGIEYKERKSDQRFGITPSLLHRYTAGTQLGVKIRSKLLREWLVLAAGATNGASVTEQFHFVSEVDQNSGKTLSGRVAVSAPVGDLAAAISGDRLELGVSGEWGPQDKATDNQGQMWFAGLDLQYLGSGYALKAQLMRGAAPGRLADKAWSLELRNSGYVELDWQMLARLGIVLRGEARDALVTLGTERAYLTKSMRLTGGARIVFSPNVILKAEYLHNREFGGIAQFRNDVFTSSLVLAY